MKRVQIRPRYTFSVPLEKAEVLTRLRKALSKEPPGLEGKFVKPLVVVSIDENERHFWSPELSLDIEEKKDETEIRCTLGPRSSLWTMFATFYGFSVLAGVAGLILGFSQLTLGMNAWGFWLVPASVILIASAYGIAIAGQRLAYEQTLKLRSFIKKTLKSEN